jgi:hypothetical protein
MDAGKIRSFTPGVDLRADSGSASQSGRRSDAGEVLAKVAPLLALDSLLTSSDADLHGADAPVLTRQPPNGVVVNLSLPALSADAARQLARTLAPVTDYSHLDPHKPHPERAAMEAPVEAEPVTTAAAAASIAGRDNAQSATSLGARPDLHPHAVQHAAQFLREAVPLQNRGQTPKMPGSDPVDQARAAERLAGLGLAAERFAGTPAQLGKLALGAAMVGALIVVLLL